MAPAKDVVLAGSVAIDVTDPTTPAVLGNCTLADDLSFYASGVGIEGTTLYVAGALQEVTAVSLKAASASQSANQS